MRGRWALLVAGTVALTLAVDGVASAASDVTPPTTPTNLRVTASTDTTVTLAWNPSTDNSGAFHYVLADQFGSFSYPSQSQTGAQRTGLRPATTYTFTIRARDLSGNLSGPSSVSHTTPPDVTPPSSPTLTVTYLAPARMSVSWTASTDNSGLLVFYTLLVNGAPRSGDIGNGLGRTLLDLTPATPYSLVVQARDPAGNTALSNTVNVTTPVKTDFTAPSAPANLRGRADVGGCEVYLRWDQSVDNVDAQTRILYRFHVNGQLAPSSSFVIGRGTNVGASVLEGPGSGLTTFTVEAVDGSGNVSALSNELPLTIVDC
jgi:chitodextrinase